MTTALATKTPGQEVALAGEHRNPYTELATAVRPSNIYGTLLKFNKGHWLAGESEVEVRQGTQLVAVMNKLATGWVRWENKRPTDQVMVEIESGKPPRRSELGDTDKAAWELDDRGQPKDPWAFTMYLPLLGKDGTMYTFAASSKGGINAIGQLSGVYGAFVGVHTPKEYPVVKLLADTYKHPKYSRVDVPVLGVEKYVSIASVAAAVAAGLTAGPDKGQQEEEFIQSEDPAAGMDDEIPF